MKTNGKKLISERERQILVLASKGHTDKAIADHLGISTRTVGTYWERLKVKTEGTSRANMVMKVLGEELEVVAREAEEAREEMDILLEQAESYAVLTMNSQGIILDWNPGILRVLGFEREEFVGRNFDVIFTPDDVRRGVPGDELLAAAEHGRVLERRYHQRRDGTHVWIDGTLIAIYDAAGKVKKYSKIMRDDSERKQMEEQIQLLQARK